MTTSALAAPGDKPARATATPADLQEQAARAQQMLNQLTPEQRQMMERMGIPVPAAQGALTAPGAPDLAGAARDTLGPVPRRAGTRIDAIPKASLNQAGMAAYLEATHRHVTTRIKPASRDLGDKVFGQLRAQGKSAAAIGGAGVGLWMMGRVELALHVMGKALALDLADTDNQSNYAAMLAMSGGEPLAIPLLDKLDRQFPRNSTILNNLGQAWFNLGDLDKATRYLDEALRIQALHPQANHTRSYIEEARGNKDKALDFAKRAVRYSLSLDKENHLRKLGYKLTGKDIRGLARPDADPMGLSAFRHPAFPKTVDEEFKARREWAAFANEASARIEKLTQRQREIKSPEKVAQAAMAAQAHFTGGPGAQAEAPSAALPLARRARLMLALAEKDGGMRFRLDKAQADLKAHQKAMLPLHVAYEKDVQALDRKLTAQTGDGRANKDFCAQYASLATNYLTATNAGYEQLFDAYLHQLRLKLNEELYWMQFTKAPEDFAYAQGQHRIQWLGALASVSYGGAGKVAIDEGCLGVQPPNRTTALAEFNDLHCAYHSELDLGLGKITSDCNRMTTELGVGFLKLGLRQDMDKNTFSDQFVSCTVEVSADKGVDVKLGPLSVGVGAQVGVGIEIGRSGVQDLYLTGSVGAGVGTNVMEGLSDQGHEASMAGLGVGDARVLGVGAGGRISLISGRAAPDGLNVAILE